MFYFDIDFNLQKILNGCLDSVNTTERADFGNAINMANKMITKVFLIMITQGLIKHYQGLFPAYFCDKCVIGVLLSN